MTLILPNTANIGDPDHTADHNLIVTALTELDGRVSLPAGGTVDQVLAKQSSTDGDAVWVDPPTSLPAGGTTGQVLAKQSNADGDAGWDDVAAGSGVVFQATQPVAPTVGERWVDSDEDAPGGSVVGSGGGASWPDIFMVMGA